MTENVHYSGHRSQEDMWHVTYSSNCTLLYKYFFALFMQKIFMEIIVLSSFSHDHMNPTVELHHICYCYSQILSKFSL